MASDSTRATLKGHFNTGDKPTQQNFYDLIESNVNITDDSTINGSIKFADGVAGITGVVAPTITAKTQMANAFSAALVKNTHYLTPADGNAFTATLPTQAASTVGDTIILEWQVAISNSQTQKVGTAGEFFMAKSAIYKGGGVEISAVDIADGTADDFANFVGLTNAGPGIGSYAVITFNGSVWRLEANCTKIGTGAVAGTSVFATS